MRNGLIILMLGVLTGSCSGDPEPIEFGKDQGEYCRMTITDPKYGAELITEKGRVVKYDAAECMVRDIREKKRNPQAKLAIAYDDPKNLHSVDSLYFIIDAQFQSPMGANLAAFTSRENLPVELRDRAMTWEEVVNSIPQKGSDEH